MNLQKQTMKIFIAGLLSVSLLATPIVAYADGASGTGKTLAAEVVASQAGEAESTAQQQSDGNTPEWRYVPVRRYASP